MTALSVGCARGNQVSLWDLALFQAVPRGMKNPTAEGQRGHRLSRRVLGKRGGPPTGQVLVVSLISTA